MNIAVIRHLAFEGLGVLQPLLEVRSQFLTFYDVGVDEVGSVIKTADLVIVLGGPISANDTYNYPYLIEERDAIKHRLQNNKPTLGICLGAQLIALAMGASVYAGSEKEIGWGEVALTEEGEASCLPALNGQKVLHWHGETFDIPPNATRLAGTHLYPNQAFSVGTNILALQFHVEAEPSHIEQWLIGHSCELEMAKIDPCDIRQQTQKVAESSQKAGISMISNWLEQLEY